MKSLGTLEDRLETIKEYADAGLDFITRKDILKHSLKMIKSIVEDLEKYDDLLEEEEK